LARPDLLARISGSYFHWLRELWDRLSLVAIVNRRVRPCTENLSSSSWQRLPPLLCTPLLPLPRAYRTATAYKGVSGVIQAIASFPTINNAWPPRAALMPIAGSIPCTPTVSNGADIGVITDLERATTRPADVLSGSTWAAGQWCALTALGRCVSTHRRTHQAT